MDKVYIMKLFPSKRIPTDFHTFWINIKSKIHYSFWKKIISAIKIPKNQIQIEIDENNRRTGYAFVAFDEDEDYDAALKSDFKAINP